MSIKTYASQEWVNNTLKNTQADWGQNDPSAIDYIKNRTHWVEEAILLPETTFVYSEDAGAFVTEGSMELVVGNNYTVIWNGVSYDVICGAYEGVGALGNIDATLQTGDNGLPFFIASFDGMIMAVPLDGSESVTVSISGEQIEKLPHMYLTNNNIINAANPGSIRSVLSTEESDTYTLGVGAFAIGLQTVASGAGSHAEGMNTKAENDAAHAEGSDTTASGLNSHTEGSNTTASGTDSHAEGTGTTASGFPSHAEGQSTIASGSGSHAEGNGTVASGKCSHAEGSNTAASGEFSHAEGSSTAASSNYSHAEGRYTTASGVASHAEGRSSNTLPTTITTSTSNADIISTWNTTKFTLAKGESSHAEGRDTLALGSYSHAEGERTTASGDRSHAEGFQVYATGPTSHAEGSKTTACNICSHAEGEGRRISLTLTGEANATTYILSAADSDIRVGRIINYDTVYAVITAYDPHALTVTVDKTLSTTALASAGAELLLGIAYGTASHSEGYCTTAFGNFSHAEGVITTASGDHQHVQGKYNISDVTSAHIVGNGPSDLVHSNAHTLDWDGNAWFAGDVYVGSTSGTNKDDGSKKLAKLSDIPTKTSELTNDSGFVTSNEVIIDVVELPTHSINTNAMYRLLTANVVFGKAILAESTGYCVDELPEVGVPVTDTSMSAIVAYYNITDGGCYGYVDATLSAGLSATTGTQIPAGWYDMAMLCQALGGVYGGVVTTPAECLTENAYYLLLTPVPYFYKNGAWVSCKGISASTGVLSEVFNTPFNIASGYYSHAEGRNTEASGANSHSEGYNTTASGHDSHAEGYETTASGYVSHAEGRTTIATGDFSHAEGTYTTASGSYSHAEGQYTTASETNSHAEGWFSHAEGDASHAEGNNTTASGPASHAEGVITTASGYASHAEGNHTTASGHDSHAEGSYTTASEQDAHAEGNSTTASGYASHAEGCVTTASGDHQHVQGKYNISDMTSAHIVGNGTAEEARSNAHTLDWDGNAWYAGDVYVGSTSGTNKDEGSKKLATEEFVTTQIPNYSYYQINLSLTGNNTYILEINDNGVNQVYNCTLKDYKWKDIITESTAINQTNNQYFLTVTDLSRDDLISIADKFSSANISKFSAILDYNRYFTTSLCVETQHNFMGMYFQCGNSLIRIDIVNEGDSNEPV